MGRRRGSVIGFIMRAYARQVVTPDFSQWHSLYQPVPPYQYRPSVDLAEIHPRLRRPTVISILAGWKNTYYHTSLKRDA